VEPRVVVKIPWAKVRDVPTTSNLASSDDFLSPEATSVSSEAAAMEAVEAAAAGITESEAARDASSRKRLLRCGEQIELRHDGAEGRRNCKKRRKTTTDTADYPFTKNNLDNKKSISTNTITTINPLKLIRRLVPGTNKEEYQLCNSKIQEQITTKSTSSDDLDPFVMYNYMDTLPSFSNLKPQQESSQEGDKNLVLVRSDKNNDKNFSTARPASSSSDIQQEEEGKNNKQPKKKTLLSPAVLGAAASVPSAGVDNKINGLEDALPKLCLLQKQKNPVDKQVTPNRDDAHVVGDHVHHLSTTTNDQLSDQCVDNQRDMPILFEDDQDLTKLLSTQVDGEPTTTTSDADGSGDIKACELEVKETSVVVVTKRKASVIVERETDGKWMYCQIKGCHFWTRKQVRMDRHEMSHVPGDDRFYQCPECQLKICSLPKLLRHDRKFHTGFKDYECKICEAEVTDIAVHMRVSYHCFQSR
jgi:hypothetical protein